MIHVRDALKIYATARALDGVTTSFAVDGLHVLLGSSGSGKSTLLRAVLGLISLDGGSITIDGVDVATMSPAARAARIGYVPQDAGLFPHLTAGQNITLVARTQDWSRERIQARLKQLNEVASVDESWLDRLPRDLSGGQRQRIALQRALFLDPPLILMDEPFGALDPLVRAKVQIEFKALIARLEKTVLFVTHDVREAAFLSDDITLMHEGRVVQAGSFDDLLERPATPFVREFLEAQRLVKSS